MTTLPNISLSTVSGTASASAVTTYGSIAPVTCHEVRGFALSEILFTSQEILLYKRDTNITLFSRGRIT